MTREIKFRVANPNIKEWLYFNLVDDSHAKSFFSLLAWINAPKYQFTGLTDKNGVEIYEGDIVQSRFVYLDGETPDFVENFVVTWEKDSCGFEPFSDSKENCRHCGGGEKPEKVTVIGNIYQNPELLNNQNEN